jgi:hypothetical protein
MTHETGEVSFFTLRARVITHGTKQTLIFDGLVVSSATNVAVLRSL